MAGLYLHIPFCRSKCSYCDFYSLPRIELADEYIESLIAELALRREELGCGPLSTIYIGGGTPSSLSDSQLQHLVSSISSLIDPSSVEEFTIEVNPEDVNNEFVERIKSLGINRVSMGVQSLSDVELAAVGRRHNASTAIEAIRILESNISNYSLDIIYGLPHQTLDSLSDTLEQLFQFRPSHLSAYLLSYEPGTRLYASLLASKIEEVSDEMAQKMYLLLTQRLADAGYQHYEISNFALPGCYSRHNSSYWNLTPYLGLGASAHSFDGEVRRYNPSDIKKYISAIKSGSTCFIIDEETQWQKFNDWLMISLRTAKGLSLDNLARWPEYIVSEFQSQLSPLLHNGDVIVNDNFLKIPPNKWLTADSVIRELILTF